MFRHVRWRPYPRRHIYGSLRCVFSCLTPFDGHAIKVSGLMWFMYQGLQHVVRWSLLAVVTASVWVAVYALDTYVFHAGIIEMQPQGKTGRLAFI